MICKRCGCESFTVTSNVKRTEFGDQRLVKCRSCGADYSTIETIESAVVYNPKTMQTRYLNMSEYQHHLETEDELYEHYQKIKTLKLFQ